MNAITEARVNTMMKSTRRIGARGNKRPREFRPVIDLGTPELRRKRLESLGAPREGWPVMDTALAESVLGCLLMQGYLHPVYDIAKRMHDAGVAFAGWWTLVHPKTHAQGTLGQFAPKEASVLTPAEQAAANAEAERLLSEASVVLKRERQVYDAVVNTCVYHRLNYDNIEKLRQGLRWLVEWMRGR